MVTPTAPTVAALKKSLRDCCIEMISAYVRESKRLVDFLVFDRHVCQEVGTRDQSVLDGVLTGKTVFRREISSGSAPVARPRLDFCFSTSEGNSFCDSLSESCSGLDYPSN